MKKYKIQWGKTPNFRSFVVVIAFLWNWRGRFWIKTKFGHLMSWQKRNIGKKPYLTTCQGGGSEKIQNTVWQQESTKLTQLTKLQGGVGGEEWKGFEITDYTKLTNVILHYRFCQFCRLCVSIDKIDKIDKITGGQDEDFSIRRTTPPLIMSLLSNLTEMIKLTNWQNYT